MSKLAEIIIEDNHVFSGRLDAYFEGACANPHWVIRLLPDHPQGKAEILAQRADAVEVYRYFEEHAKYRQVYGG